MGIKQGLLGPPLRAIWIRNIMQVDVVVKNLLDTAVLMDWRSCCWSVLEKMIFPYHISRGMCLKVQCLNDTGSVLVVSSKYWSSVICLMLRAVQL